MYIDYMTKSYNNLMKSCTVQNSQKPSSSFLDKVAEKIEEGADISKAGEAKAISTKEMSIEEYKQYIYDEISKLPISHSQMNCSFFVNISEAGFEAMKNDPEYEKWVLDTLRRDFGFTDPWANVSKGRYTVHSFGAAMEDYIGQSWSKGCFMDNRRTEKSFWEKRQERRKKLQKQYAQVQAKKAMWKRVLESEKSQAIHENRMISIKENGYARQTGYVDVELSQAYAAYQEYAVANIALKRLLAKAND